MSGQTKTKRNQEMRRLRHVEKWSVEEIAALFGVSRQRAHQIVGNSGYKNYKSERITQIIQARGSLESNDEIAESLGLHQSTVSNRRRYIYHAVKPGDTNTRRHDDCKRWVKRVLERLGHEVVLQPLWHPFDMLLDGKVRVSVALSGTERRPPSQKLVSPGWAFNLTRALDENDFLLAVTAYKDVFVIPTSVLPRRKGNIIFCYPSLRESMGKYQQYHERYDLLKGVQNE